MKPALAGFFMSKITSNKGLEALLFIGFAFSVWLAMRISNTEVTRQINVELIAVGRAVDGIWLEDSTQELSIIIEASGLDALFMDRFDERLIPFDSDDFLRTSTKSAYLLNVDIQTILQQEYGREYRFKWSGDSLIFPSSTLVSKTLPVALLSPENISIPEGHRWIQRPTLEPDSIECMGPEALLLDFQPSITAPFIVWDGLDKKELPLDKLPRYITANVNWLNISASADAWTEVEQQLNLRYQNQDYPIVLWLSGPMSTLVNTPESYIDLEWRMEDQRLRVDIRSLTPGVEVLNYEPKYVQL
ncbi:MAG: hypothetical protein VW775_03190 [Schleiferiaceae bacterium]